MSSSRYGADQGRALGAAVNVVTKSGTNDYHGSYFVFYRNQDLNARDPFQAKKTDFNRTQQGFTLGGPIIRNRTFFFGAFENTGEKNLGIVNTNGIYPQFEGSFALPFTSRLLTTRLDHQLTNKQRLMLRYSYENNFSLQGIALAERNTQHGSGLGRWRWVVERTFAWLNQFRRLRVRYEKRADIHEAFLSLGCALICWRFLHASWNGGIRSRLTRISRRQ